MRNYVAPGNTVPFIAATDVLSGQPVKSGALFGVSAASYTAGQEGELTVTGVFDLPKVSAEAWTLHAKIYWDATAKRCTTTAGSNVLIGAAYASVAANSAGIGRVRLNGVAV